MERRKEHLPRVREGPHLHPVAMARDSECCLEDGETVEILLSLDVCAFEQQGVVWLREGVKNGGRIAVVGYVAGSGVWHCSALSERVGMGNEN